MDAVRLHFPEPDAQVLLLSEGNHDIGWHDGRLGPVSEKIDALLLLRISMDRRGIWMSVLDKATCVHLNGRQIHRLALLRSGDVIYLDNNLKLRLTSPARPLPAQTQSSPQIAETNPWPVLRALGGPDHGRCFTLNRPCLAGRSSEADIQIDDPACDKRHAWLERLQDQDRVLLRHPAISGRSLVNGLPLHEAVLAAGDQVTFTPRHRFVIEAPNISTRYSPLPTTPASTLPPPRSLRPLLWLLVAAALLAAALTGVLLFGEA